MEDISPPDDQLLQSFRFFNVFETPVHSVKFHRIIILVKIQISPKLVSTYQINVDLSSNRQYQQNHPLITVIGAFQLSSRIAFSNIDHKTITFVGQTHTRVAQFPYKKAVRCIHINKFLSVHKQSIIHFATLPVTSVVH